MVLILIFIIPFLLIFSADFIFCHCLGLSAVLHDLPLKVPS